MFIFKKWALTMIFNLLDALTRPANLVSEGGMNVVDMDDGTCKVYSQNTWGIWSFYAIVRRSSVKIK